MNNKKISCVAKNNEINAPKTRTVTIQMNCKLDDLTETYSSPSATHVCENPEEAEFPHRGGEGADSLRGEAGGRGHCASGDNDGDRQEQQK